MEGGGTDPVGGNLRRGRFLVETYAKTKKKNERIGSPLRGTANGFDALDGWSGAKKDNYSSEKNGNFIRTTGNNDVTVFSYSRF